MIKGMTMTAGEERIVSIERWIEGSMGLSVSNSLNHKSMVGRAVYGSAERTGTGFLCRHMPVKLTMHQSFDQV